MSITTFRRSQHAAVRTLGGRAAPEPVQFDRRTRPSLEEQRADERETPFAKTCGRGQFSSGRQHRRALYLAVDLYLRCKGRVRYEWMSASPHAFRIRSDATGRSVFLGTSVVVL